MGQVDEARAARARDMYEGWRSYAVGMDEYWRMREERAAEGARLGPHPLSPWFAGVARHATFERLMTARLRLMMLLRARAMGGYSTTTEHDSSDSSPSAR